jgi:DNA invertase Pin-like site-specific DNA recombinase
MKRLTREKQAQIISALIEGCSIRATARMTGVSKDTERRLSRPGVPQSELQARPVR